MQKKKCPRNDCERDAVIDPQYGVMPCNECQNKDAVPMSQLPYFSHINRSNRAREDWDHHEKDQLQPFMGMNDTPNIDFAKAYPDRVNDYYTPEQQKKMDI